MDKKITGFHFQEIPLQEAQKIAIAGNGKYSELQAELLERLPALSPDKAFAFGLPDGKEVPQEERRAITQGINHALTRGAAGWRVIYSERDKLFVCIPKALKASNGKSAPAAPAKARTKTGTISPQELVEIARNATDYHEKDWTKEGRSIRAAICVVSEELGISPKKIAPSVGLFSNSVYYCRRYTKEQRYRKYADKIRAALKERGTHA